MISQETKQEIIEKYKSGLGSDTVAKEYNIHPNTVLKILKKAGIDRRGPTRKINEEDEKEIIKLYNEGISAPKIAAKFNVSDAIILKYLEKNGVDRRSAEEAHRIYEINENFFDTIDTEEKAYFLGLLYADGGMSNIPGNRYIRIELKRDDKDILKRFAGLIFKENPESHIKESVRVKEYNGEERTYYSSYITIHSKHMCEQLIKLGCGERKSLILTWPEWLADSELQRHFIRGYYDGDGGMSTSYIKKRGAVLKIISTMDMCYNMSKIMDKTTGVHFSFYNDVKDKDVYTIHTCGNRQIKTLLDWLYKDATVYLNRKYDKYQELLKQIEETNKLIEVGTQGYSKSNLTK